MRRWIGRIRRSRLRLRTALALVAVMAVLLVASIRWIPYVLWRLRLERLIAARVEGAAPGDQEVWSNPSFQLYHGLSDDDSRDFRRDPGLVVDRLLRAIGDEGDEGRRQKVLRSLSMYLDEVKGPELSRKFIARGVGMLSSGTLPIRLETDLASSVARRAVVSGISAVEREAFRARARIVLGTDLPHPDYAKIWAWSLAQFRGRQEAEVILGAWDRLDRNGRSKILEVGLPGMGPEELSRRLRDADPLDPGGGSVRPPSPAAESDALACRPSTSGGGRP
jgi:hypothetical protein